MQRLGHQLLTRSAFALNQHRCRRRSEQRDHSLQLFYRLGEAYDLLEIFHFSAGLFFMRKHRVALGWPWPPNHGTHSPTCSAMFSPGIFAQGISAFFNVLLIPDHPDAVTKSSLLL